jgi:hypothetical protein
MSNQVYANSMEVSCKQASGKSICAFPDVCFTPPQTPATPPGVPIPYPNTGVASDTSDGSRSVQISGQEAMLRDASYFKKSSGDEAGSAPKKNVLTSKNMGKVYFNSWSMNVMIEGENVVRHMDLTTHNHASRPGGTPPWMHVDEMSAAIRAACEDEIGTSAHACRGKSQDDCGNACRNAQKCLLVPKNQSTRRCCSDAPPGRPRETTGHHLIEVHWVNGNSNFPMAQGTNNSHPGYGNAPTVCVNRYRSVGTPHRELHDVQGTFEESYLPATRTRPAGARAGQTLTYGEAKNAAVNAHQTVFDAPPCGRRCLEAQMDAFYGGDDSRAMNTPTDRQAIGQAREPLAEAYGPILGGDQPLTFSPFQ